MVDAVYVDAKEEKSIAAIKLEPPLRPISRALAARGGSGGVAGNAPPEHAPLAQACFS
jgi:hypothetical protein